MSSKTIVLVVSPVTGGTGYVCYATVLHWNPTSFASFPERQMLHAKWVVIHGKHP